MICICGKTLSWLHCDVTTQNDTFLCLSCGLVMICEHNFKLLNPKIRDNELTAFCSRCNELVTVERKGTCNA